MKNRETQLSETIANVRVNAQHHDTTNRYESQTTNVAVFEPFVLHSSLSAARGLIQIEQFQNIDPCQTPRRPWMIASNFFTGQSLFFRPTCKLWSCPSCGYVNAKRWTVRAIKGTAQLLEAGYHVDFVTLTPHEKLTAKQSFYVLPLAWKKLSMRWKYEIPKSDPAAYYAVPERHKSLKVHTHMIVTGGLSKKWWKDNARECGLGYQSEVKEVKDVGVGGYVGKYLNKTLADPWPKGTRRVNTSRTWPTLPELEQVPGWGFKTYKTDGELLPVLESLLVDGYKIFGVTTANAWDLLESLSPSIEEVQKHA